MRVLLRLSKKQLPEPLVTESSTERNELSEGQVLKLILMVSQFKLACENLISQADRSQMSCGQFFLYQKF